MTETADQPDDTSAPRMTPEQREAFMLEVLTRAGFQPGETLALGDPDPTGLSLYCFARRAADAPERIELLRVRMRAAGFLLGEVRDHEHGWHATATRPARVVYGDEFDAVIERLMKETVGG